MKEGLDWRVGLPALAGGAVLVTALTMAFLDVPAYRAAQRLPALLVDAAGILTHAGDLRVVLGVLVAAFLAARIAGWRRSMRGALFLLAAVGVARSAVALLKPMFGRARPSLFDAVGPWHFEPLTLHYDFASLPSGHATNFLALATGLGMLVPKWRIPLLLAGVALALTRVVLGQHYLSDVAAGGFLAAGIAALLGRWAKARGHIDP